MRLWAKRHRELSAMRTQVVCRLHAVLCELTPGGVRKRITVPMALRVLENLQPEGAIAQARYQLAFRSDADACGDGGEAGLGGGVAFGVDDVDVVAGGEAEFGEAEESFGFAGAGEAEDDGAEAEAGVGDGGPLPCSPVDEVAADPGAEHRLGADLERCFSGAAAGPAEVGVVFGGAAGLSSG
jgi:hypothetical protein